VGVEGEPEASEGWLIKPSEQDEGLPGAELRVFSLASVDYGGRIRCTELETFVAARSIQALPSTGTTVEVQAKRLLLGAEVGSVRTWPLHCRAGWVRLGLVLDLYCRMNS